MNRVTTPKFIQEEQRHFIPNDVDPWFATKSQIAKPDIFWTQGFVKISLTLKMNNLI